MPTHWILIKVKNGEIVYEDAAGKNARQFIIPRGHLLGWHSTGNKPFVIAFKNGSPFESGVETLDAPEGRTTPEMIKKGGPAMEIYHYLVVLFVSPGKAISDDPDIIIDDLRLRQITDDRLRKTPRKRKE